MAEKLGIDSDMHELKLGSSFETGSSSKDRSAFHSLRYDFKPASVDTSQVASVEIGESHSVSVTLPHVEGSGTSQTVYKGNKRPCQKECVLIIDHKTGTFTLEKLANNIQLKKTRIEGAGRGQHVTTSRPVTPTEKLKEVKTSPSRRPVAAVTPTTTPAPSPAPAPAPAPSPAPVSSSSSAPAMTLPPVHVAPSKDIASSSRPEAGSPSATPNVGVMSSSSDSSSGSDSSSDSESEDSDHKKSPPPMKRSSQPTRTHSSSTKPGFHSTLSEDLQLSESGSDSE